MKKVTFSGPIKDEPEGQPQRGPQESRSKPANPLKLAFQSRPVDLVGISNQRKVVDFNGLQPVRIDGASDCTIHISKKAISLAIVNCSNCVISLKGIVGKLNVVNCTNCTIAIAEYCGTIHVGNTGECNLLLNRTRLDDTWMLVAGRVDTRGLRLYATEKAVEFRLEGEDTSLEDDKAILSQFLRNRTPDHSVMVKPVEGLTPESEPVSQPNVDEQTLTKWMSAKSGEKAFETRLMAEAGLNFLQQV